MSRPIRIAAIALVVFVAAAAAGVRVASHWGSERTRTVLERVLSEQLGAPVSVDQAHLYFGTSRGGPLSWLNGFLLDAQGIETRPENAEAGPQLAITRLQAQLDFLALLGGEVRIRSLALDGVHAQVGRNEAPQEIVPEPELIMRAPDLPNVSSAPPDEALDAATEPVVGFLEAMVALAEQTLSGPLADQEVSIQRSEVEFLAPPLSAEGEPLRLRLRDVAGRLRPSGRGQRASLTLEGAIPVGGAAARMELALERDARGELDARLSVRELALSAAAPILTAFLPTAHVDGVGDVSLLAQRPQEGVFHLSGRVDAREISGSLPRMGDAHPIPVALDYVRAGMDVDIDPERIHVEHAFVSTSNTELGIEAESARPIRPEAHTTARVSLDRYDLTQRRHLIALLPPRQIQTVEAALEPVHSGRVEDVEISGRATLGEWIHAFDDESEGLLPDTIEAHARFTGFAVRAGEGETLTDLSGTVSWRGDRLALRGVRGRRAGHWLPVLDATLDGVSNLAANADLPEIPDSDDAPVMLGLGPMYDIVIDPNKPPGEMPGALLLSLDHVVHPTLIWPLRNLFARANPGEDGIRVLLEHGVWGRVPIRAEGVWSMQPDEGRRIERVAVRIEVKPPIGGLPPIDPSDPVWARGRWHLDAHNLGAWRVLTSAGAFHASGQNVRLVTYDLDLGVAGRALGEGTIDFSRPDELPYWTTVRVVDAKAPGIVDKIGFAPEEATGDVVLDGDFHGELRPGRRVLAGMEGTLQVSARDGTILKRLPVILAIAKASDTFNPFGKRDEMRFSEIDALLDMHRGQVHARELRINGPDLRLLASGTVDALDPEHPVQAVVGIFFFKALDRMIGVVPLVSDLLLGEDENLMGAYVELTGAWAQPNASLVPLKTLATGPASAAMEGVPRFVRRAITAIQSAFQRTAPDVAAPPPSRGEDS